MSLQERAKQDGPVNIATSGTAILNFYRQFESEKGVPVQVYRGTEFLSRLEQEQMAGNVTFDIAFADTTDYLNLLQRNDVWQECPQTVVEDTPAKMQKGKDGMNVAFMYAVAPKLTLLYNKETLSDPPTSFDELWQSKYKGEILADSRDTEWIPFGDRQFDSTDRTKQFVQNLAAHCQWSSSHFDSAKKVARGDKLFSVTYKKYLWYDFGGSLAEVPIDDFPVTSAGNYASLIKGAKNPTSGAYALKYYAKNFMEYMSEKYNPDLFYTPEQADSKGIVYFNPQESLEIDWDRADRLWLKWTGLQST